MTMDTRGAGDHIFKMYAARKKEALYIEAAAKHESHNTRTRIGQPRSGEGRRAIQWERAPRNVHIRWQGATGCIKGFWIVRTRLWEIIAAIAMTVILTENPLLSATVRYVCKQIHVEFSIVVLRMK